MEKRKKPKFLRSESHKKIRLGRTVKKKRKWRAPKGRQNKIRLHRKGRPRKPRIGWGSPKEIRNKINGQEVFIISNINQLENLQPNTAILLSSRLGKKKKEKIIETAKEKKIKIINHPKLKKSQKQNGSV